MTGEETRKRLGLEAPKPRKKKKKDDDAPPPLHRKKGSRVKPQPKSNDPLVNEIDEMNKAL